MTEQLKAACEQALAVLENFAYYRNAPGWAGALISLRAALAAQVAPAVPVAYITKNDVLISTSDLHLCHPINEPKPLYATPQLVAIQQPLTDDQIAQLWSPYPGGLKQRPIMDDQIAQLFSPFPSGLKQRPIMGWGTLCDFARAIEAAHGIGDKP